MKIIENPNVENCGSWCDFFEQIKKNYGTPDYMLGVTFGVDLNVWRKILSVMFNDETTGEKVFNKKKKFDRACLITDVVKVVDNDPGRDFISNNLNLVVVKTAGYLHTKFILLRYENANPEYVLCISSKNITANDSYDFCFALESFRPDNNDLIEKKNNHGEKIYNYIEYLLKKGTGQMPTELGSLIEYSFRPEREEREAGWRLVDFEIAYPETRGADSSVAWKNMLWEKIYSSEMIISPFLDREQMLKVQEQVTSAQEVNSDARVQKVKVLAYPEQIQKILDASDGEDHLSCIDFYMGKVSVINRDRLYQNKFHSKIYIGKNWLILGSANLTSTAKTSHCEMLVSFEIPNSVYEEMALIFEPRQNLTERYDKEKALVTLLEGEESQIINEDELLNGISGSIGRQIGYYVCPYEERWQLFLNDKVIAIFDSPLFYIETGDEVIFLSEDTYADDKRINAPALNFESYRRLVASNLSKMIEGNDMLVLQGKRRQSGETSNGNRGRNDGTGMIVDSVPCIYETIFDEIRKYEKGSEVEQATIKYVLENMAESVYGDELNQFIGQLIEKCGEVNE